MTAQTKYPVSPERMERFFKINEILREMTVFAEAEFLNQFNDLSVMQIEVIRIINYHNPCTMSQIAKSTRLTLGSVTQIMDKLIKKKYVKRVRSDDDRRVVYAELTAKGLKIIAASKNHVKRSAEHIMGRFSERDQEIFLQFFQKMAE